MGQEPVRGAVPTTMRRRKMVRKANLPILLALTVGAVGGWAGASGRFDSLLKAEPPSTAAKATPGEPPPAGECCAAADRLTAVTAINAHNEKVSARLRQEGKKPNILVIFGDDVGQ